jgi:hypothetical protein
MIDRVASIVTMREQFERLGFIFGHVGERLIGVEVSGGIFSDSAYRRVELQPRAH